MRKNSKEEKSIIILTLGDVMRTKTRAIVVQYAQSAKELWDELRRLYTTPKYQDITNLINRLSLLVLEEKKENWDKLRLNFMSIIDKLGSYVQKISDKEKKTKLLRALPESFKPISMVWNVTRI